MQLSVVGLVRPKPKVNAHTPFILYAYLVGNSSCFIISNQIILCRNSHQHLNRLCNYIYGLMVYLVSQISRLRFALTLKMRSRYSVIVESFVKSQRCM